MMNQNNISIAKISFYFYPEYSGAAKQALSLAKQLRDNGVNSFFIAAQLDRSWPKEEIVDGFQVYRVPMSSSSSIIDFWKGVAGILWEKRREYDIVHSHGMNPLHGFSMFWARMIGKPGVAKLSIAQSDINFIRQGRLVGRIHKFYLRFANKYIAISSALQHELKQNGLNDKKCLLLPNGVDTHRFHPVSKEQKLILRKKYKLPLDSKIILFVGVIDKRKGIDVLIDAFISIARKEKNALLYVVGPRNRDDRNELFYKSLLKVINENNITNQVLFKDYCSHIEDMYQMADLFVLPSRQEGLPNAILEAMSCGLPVIGTNISGTQDVINDNKDGLLVPAENKEALSRGIEDLMVNAAKSNKLSIAARRKIETEFSLGKITQSYINLYNDLLRRR